MFELGIKLLLSYLLGAVNGALFLGRFRGIDIRKEGSGNAGATNALRTHGWFFAVFAALIDIGKGVLAVIVVASLPGLGAALLQPHWTAVLCGLAAVIGHIYPVWYDFRGGKGGATAVGALLGFSPVAVIAVVAVWLLVLVGSGYVGLATMTAAVSVPLFALVWQPGGFDLPLFFYGVAVAMLVLFAHRSNIANMRRGEEHRMTGAMFWRRGSKHSS